MIKAVRKVAVTATIIVLTLVGIYWYWTTMPFFSFQQAFFAVLDKDVDRFVTYVDVDSFVDNLLDDLITRPAETTPGLSETQKEVGLGAIAMTRVSIANDLKRSLRRLFSAQSTAPGTSWLMAPAQAQEIAQRPQPITVDSVKQLLNVVGREAGDTAARRKTEAYERMKTYLSRHPDTILGQILNAPPDRRGLIIEDLITQFGFTRESFKGLVPCVTTGDGTGNETAIAGFVFGSPKLQDDIVVQVELLKLYNSNVWRIKRISNVRELMLKFEPSYEDDIHNLVAYSLVGISNQNINRDLRGVTDKIKQDPAARQLLERFNIK
ncbi:MAG: hypothetical protein IPP57_02420 [Candidatus Obscuribacter sp.]|nr:hypothetical protein [Candidatus Obscuribacter sp.]